MRLRSISRNSNRIALSRGDRGSRCRLCDWSSPMKITEVRLLQLHGSMELEGELWEERLIRPVDIYPEHKIEGPTHLPKSGENRYGMTSIFIEIQTDEGVIGIGGPIPLDQAFIVGTQLRQLLIGADPLAHELIWDRL